MARSYLARPAFDNADRCSLTLPLSVPTVQGSKAVIARKPQRNAVSMDAVLTRLEDEWRNG
jgi:hypothetical protein